jgi:hypothetical protein
MNKHCDFFQGQYLPLPGGKITASLSNSREISIYIRLYPFISVYNCLYTVVETEVELLPTAQGQGAHRPFNPMLLFFV